MPPQLYQDRVEQQTPGKKFLVYVMIVVHVVYFAPTTTDTTHDL